MIDKQDMRDVAAYKLSSQERISRMRVISERPTSAPTLSGNAAEIVAQIIELSSKMSSTSAVAARKRQPQDLTKLFQPNCDAEIMPRLTQPDPKSPNKTVLFSRPKSNKKYRSLRQVQLRLQDPRSPGAAAMHSVRLTAMVKPPTPLLPPPPKKCR
jgi:hypothetical protein